MMGAKEPQHAATQRAQDPRRHPRPASGRGRSEDGVRSERPPRRPEEGTGRDKPVVTAAQKEVWLWSVPAAGVIVCAAWAVLLISYRQLNRAKFTVLQEIEADLPFQLFRREREAYRRNRRWSLSYIETAIPGCFALLYILMLIAVLVTSH